MLVSIRLGVAHGPSAFEEGSGVGMVVCMGDRDAVKLCIELPVAGAAKLDADGRVLGFEESSAASVPINTGVYVFGPGPAPLLPDRGDHERSTFPMLAGQGLCDYGFDVPWRPTLRLSPR